LSGHIVLPLKLYRVVTVSLNIIEFRPVFSHAERRTIKVEAEVVVVAVVSVDASTARGQNVLVLSVVYTFRFRGTLFLVHEIKRHLHCLIKVALAYVHESEKFVFRGEVKAVGNT